MTKRTLWIPLGQFVLVINSVVVLVPLLIMALSAFKNTREIFQDAFGLPVVWRWENFTRVWVEAKF
ncbi:MAG TPA: carbohydrate ABC transporter permease, partial [bacterium]|nr:carbohydrate ABC transporter permease [bacterium]